MIKNLREAIKNMRKKITLYIKKRKLGYPTVIGRILKMYVPPSFPIKH